MDETKQFIKMCDCTEIQSNHKCGEGDTFYEKLVKPQPGGYQEGVYLEYEDHTWGSHTEDETYPREKLIWLPRQDQLQEMVTVSHEEEYNKSMYPVLESLYQFACSMYTNRHPPTSMEQLWLAFVMREKYSKAWNNEKGNWLDIKKEYNAEPIRNDNESSTPQTETKH